MTYENIIISIDEGIATVAINRPRSFNILDAKTLEELYACFRNDISHNEAVKAVILTGKGEKAFCGGADIKAMKGMDVFQATDFSQEGQRVMDAIEDAPKPVIAAVNGYALGGGFELALACDLIIASENAQFAASEINVGITTGWGCSKRLPEAIGAARAKELLFTGAMIDAPTALRLGIVNRVVPADRLNEETIALARQLAGKAVIALALVKKAVNHSRHLDREKAALIESEVFGACFATVDQKEGMTAFEEKRKPVFIGK